MHSTEDFAAQIERDRLQRESEIRLIENLTRGILNDQHRMMLYRTLVIVLYSHVEGFCKFCLYIYVSAINKSGISCRQASRSIAAASLRSAFDALRKRDSKHPVFRNKVPSDDDIHMLWREREFLAQIEKIFEAKVHINDNIVDTKSNLGPVVLKRNLYQLGLDFEDVIDHSGALHRLVNTRNAIAHGDIFQCPDLNTVALFRTSAFEIMDFVQRAVLSAIKEKKFLVEPISTAQ